MLIMHGAALWTSASIPCLIPGRLTESTTRSGTQDMEWRWPHIWERNWRSRSPELRLTVHTRTFLFPERRSECTTDVHGFYLLPGPTTRFSIGSVEWSWI